MFREILLEEKVSDSETMRRENRRIAAMSWGGGNEMDGDQPPPKPSRTPMTDSTSKLFQMQENSTPMINPETGMTYIIAQNPEVLARLMEENQRRGVNAAAYNTPASVFNVLSVEFDPLTANSDTENKQQSEDMKLTMKKVHATELIPLQQDKLPSLQGEQSSDLFEKCPPQKSSPKIIPPINSFNSNLGDATENVVVGVETGYFPTSAGLPPQPPDAKSKSLERNMSANAVTNYTRISSLERARQQQKLAADYAKTRSQSLVRQFSPGIQQEQTMIRSASLERNQQVPMSFKAPYSPSFDRFQTPLPPPYVRPPTKSGSLERSQAIIMNDLMRKYYDQKSLNDAQKPRSGGSLERNVQYQQYLQMQKQQLEQQLQATQQFQSLQQQQSSVNNSQESIEENIYDFGGVHVKSCASIALKKSIERGMLPPAAAMRSPAFDQPSSGPSSLEIRPPTLMTQPNVKQPCPSIANRMMIFQQQSVPPPTTTNNNVTSPNPLPPFTQCVNPNLYNLSQPESIITTTMEPQQVRKLNFPSFVIFNFLLSFSFYFVICIFSFVSENDNRKKVLCLFSVGLN